MKKVNSIEIEEQIIAIITETEIVFLKQMPSIIFAFLFIGLTFFIMSLAGAIIKGNSALLIFPGSYLIVAMIAFIRKRVVINTSIKTVYVEYILGNYTICKLKTYSYGERKFRFTYNISEDSESTTIWFELLLNNHKLLSIASLKGINNIEKCTKKHFEIRKENFPLFNHI